MTRYTPSHHYRMASVAAVALGAFSVWVGRGWAPALLPAALFFLSAALLAYLATRPPIEVRTSHLSIGRREILWTDIRRVDRTGWASPLVVLLTLAGGARVTVIYPGDPEAAGSLLRELRRLATLALIDGIPHHEFWGEDTAEPKRERRPAPPGGRLLRAEDEAEVERLYQRLKTVGHLDSNNGSDEQ